MLETSSAGDISIQTGESEGSEGLVLGQGTQRALGQKSPSVWTRTSLRTLFRWGGGVHGGCCSIITDAGQRDWDMGGSRPGTPSGTWMGGGAGVRGP